MTASTVTSASGTHTRGVRPQRAVVHPAPQLRPPGPGVLDLQQVRTDPLRLVTDLHREFGDVTCHLVDGDPVIMVHRPDLARQVLKDNGANYTKVDTPDDHMLRPLLGNGLLTSSGEQWAAQRRMAAPAFRPGQVRRFDTLMTGAAAGMLDRWRRNDSGAEIAVDHQLTSLTLTVVVGAIVSLQVDGIGDGFGRAVDAVNSYIGHHSATGGPEQRTARLSFGQAKGFLDLVTRTLIASRRAAGGTTDAPDDLLAAMMAQDAELSEQDLLDQVLTLVMAGHETTAKSLTWALYLLHANPDWRLRLENEVDQVLGRTSDAPARLPTAADLPDLALCGRVVREAMRLYPPIWLTSRRAVAADALDGYAVQPGDLVCVSQWGLHHDHRYFPHPDRFDPDRFTDVSGWESHSYLPFGGGDRICIGQHFALMEATLVLATVVASARLRLASDCVVEPEALVTLRPRNGLRMTVHWR